MINVPAGNVEAMAQVFDEHAGRIAAVITEPIQGAGGRLSPPAGLSRCRFAVYATPKAPSSSWTR